MLPKKERARRIIRRARECLYQMQLAVLLPALARLSALATGFLAGLLVRLSLLPLPFLTGLLARLTLTHSLILLALSALSLLTLLTLVHVISHRRSYFRLGPRIKPLGRAFVQTRDKSKKSRHAGPHAGTLFRNADGCLVNKACVQTFLAMMMSSAATEPKLRGNVSTY